jgi:hypothetical protein
VKAAEIKAGDRVLYRGVVEWTAASDAKPGKGSCLSVTTTAGMVVLLPRDAPVEVARDGPSQGKP